MRGLTLPNEGRMQVKFCIEANACTTNVEKQALPHCSLCFLDEGKQSAVGQGCFGEVCCKIYDIREFQITVYREH